MHIVSFNGTNLHWALSYICEDLNKLIAAVKNSLDGIEVEEIKVDWDNVDLDNFPPKTYYTPQKIYHSTSII